MEPMGTSHGSVLSKGCLTSFNFDPDKFLCRFITVAEI